MDEITQVIPLLYMHGLSTRKVKKTVGKLLGERGLSHQNVIRITERIVGEFNLWKRRGLSELKGRKGRFKGRGERGEVKVDLHLCGV